MKKRILALAMSVIMMLSLLSVTVSAADTAGLDGVDWYVDSQEEQSEEKLCVKPDFTWPEKPDFIWPEEPEEPEEPSDVQAVRITYRWYYAPESETLPVDENDYSLGDKYQVDSKYYRGMTVEDEDGKYVFSGWHLGFIPVSGEHTVVTYFDIVLRGYWVYIKDFDKPEEPEETYGITYVWDATAPVPAPAVPVDETEYVLNQEYTVDTTYVAGETTVDNVEGEKLLGVWTFAGWDTEDGNIEGDLTITGSWTYEEVEYYTITYVWDDTAPVPAPAVPVDETEYVLNQEYTVDTTEYAPVEKETEDGKGIGTWTFIGWNTEDGKISGNLTITGSWDYTYTPYASVVEPKASVYKVEHYLEQEDGTYKLAKTEFPLYGEIGAEVVASADREFIADGYELNEDSVMFGKVIAATVENDEVVCLVLKLYYDLAEEEEPETYTVTYLVDGKVYSEKEYEAGDTVKVKAKLRDKQFYEFKGWYYPKNITVKDGKFVMPAEDVVIEGFYEYVPVIIPVPGKPDGTIKITKKLTAPADYDGDTTFTFEVYKNGTKDKDLYAIVEVEAGKSEVLSAPAGTYYIYEVNAEEKGYDLVTKCDAKNNKIKLSRGETEKVTFTNVYTENEFGKAELEKEDHFGYIIGYPDDTVRPENNITRAEIVTIFFRMLTDESREAFWTQENDFVDVNEDDWFNNAVSTLTNAGIISGYEDGTFRPNASITRAELVKIAVAFYDAETEAEADFTDTDGHWADRFIDAAYGLGFVSGYEDGSFQPDKAVTRAEAMKIINRALERYPVADGLHEDMVTWIDNMDEDAWYYADVQEATNSHEYVWETVKSEYWVDILPVRDWAALENAYSDAYDG